MKQNLLVCTPNLFQDLISDCSTKAVLKHNTPKYFVPSRYSVSTDSILYKEIISKLRNEFFLNKLQ